MALVSVQSYPGHTTHFFLCIWYLSTLTNAHHQQFYTTTYIFSFIIMSSFLLKKKKHMREALLFNLKKSAAESHRMLVEAYGDNTFGNNVQRLVSPVQWRQLWPEWQEAWKSAQEDWRLSIAGSLDEDNTQSQKMLAEQLGVKQPFPCGYMSWGRFKRSKNGCRMNWTTGRWNDAKTHAKFCLPDKKESRSCIGLWQAMKNGSIFRILNARNLGLILPNH